MNPLELPRCLIDFETRSEVDVKQVGSFAYAEHPSTQILCMSYSFNTQEACLTIPKLWFPFLEQTYELFPLEIIQHVENGFVIEAHQCLFEKAVWKELLTRKHGIPYPKYWIDTMATCAYRSIPMKLDKVGEVLDLVTKKDKRGETLLRLLCGPRKPTKKDPRIWINDVDLMHELGDYCLTDNSTEHVLSETIGDLPPAEYKLWTLDQKINERGVKIDRKAINQAKKITSKIADDLEREISLLTDGAITTGGQTSRIKDWCNDRGASLSCVTKESVKQELTYDLQPKVKRVLEIRQWLGRSSIKKLDKFLDCASWDDRIRGLLQYHGAGTGRWAGRMVQPQNFPRGTIKDMELLIEIITYGDPELLKVVFGNQMEAVSSSLRGMLIADKGKRLFVSDFSNIEARVVMWCAGQEDALEAFRANDRDEGPDIYCVMAEKLYGRPITKKDKDERGSGKVTILGCGYQMGPPRLKEQAKAQYGIDLTLDRAEFLVKTFREQYYLVPDFWQGVQNAAMDALNRPGARVSFRCVTYQVVEDAAGKWLTCELPNGRLLWYFTPRIEEVQKEWGTVWNIAYEGRNNKQQGIWSTVYTYGGMLTENIVQAISRDIMVESMYLVEYAGYQIVLTVHDEVVAEVPNGFGDIKAFDKMLAVTPVWAPGCPVAAAGWVGPRYKKD